MVKIYEILIKKTVTISLASMLFLSPITVLANDTDVDYSKTNYTTELNDYIEDNRLNSQVITKQNVRIREVWSPYRRVSSNVITGAQGGSITANQSVTWNTQVNGSILGLGISTNRSIQSGIGHTLNVGPNRRVYMGHRVRQQIETGTRVIFNPGSGRITYNEYEVITPLYGEFALINY